MGGLSNGWQRSTGGVLDLAVFLGGVTIGVVAMVAVAVRREDRLFFPIRRRAGRRGARREMADPLRRLRLYFLPRDRG